jgi:hypothetical protein
MIDFYGDNAAGKAVYLLGSCLQPGSSRKGAVFSEVEADIVDSLLALYQGRLAVYYELRAQLAELRRAGNLATDIYPAVWFQLQEVGL